MKISKRESGLLSLAFGLGLILGMAIIAMVTPSIVLKNIPNMENQEFSKVFEKGDIKVGVSIDETVPGEIKETAELLVEQFTYQVAGAIIICEAEGTEYLKIMSAILAQLASMTIEELQKNPKTPQEFLKAPKQKSKL